jgi:hypothetical protein
VTRSHQIACLALSLMAVDCAGMRPLSSDGSDLLYLGYKRLSSRANSWVDDFYSLTL